MSEAQGKTIRASLILLTLNEIDGVRALYDRIPFGAVDECIAVDGGSTDGTVEYLQARGTRVVCQDRPGRGRAFALGAATARGQYLVFFSPDGNEDPADIPRLLELLDAGNDLAIASRFTRDSRNEEDRKLFPFRKWGNLAFTRLLRLLWGGKVTDTQNGFRAIRREKFLRLCLDAQGFDIECQMTIRALKLGYKIQELSTREGDRLGGRSKLRSIPTGLKILRTILREVLLGKRFLSPGGRAAEVRGSPFRADGSP